MTAEEALKIFYDPDRIGVTIIKANTPDVAKYNNDSMAALQMAIEALEKQIPKKPIEPGSLSLFYKCPICKKSVNDHARYCAVCGYKLNWADGEG